MNKYSYYTPIDLAEEIVKLLPKRNYKTVIDICCGTWNLLYAAKKKYPDAQIFGVDVDRNTEEHILEGAEFFLGDGRFFSAEKYREGHTYDLILSNPPFGRLEASETFWNEENMDNVFPALKCKRYEAEMILANMLLAHENSILVFILPITFITGISYKKARMQIAKEFSVLDIIELPDSTFQGNKLNTAAIILEKKRGSSNKTRYRKALLKDSNWFFETPEFISVSKIRTGIWFGEKEDRRDVKICRGRIHSGDMCNGTRKVLHCSSIVNGNEWKPSVRYTEKISNIHAEYGDVLINRIGRGAGYWCINVLHDVEVSDCLLVVKSPSDKNISKLREQTEEGRLKVNLRGVSTAYITQEDIYKIINS